MKNPTRYPIIYGMLLFTLLLSPYGTWGQEEKRIEVALDPYRSIVIHRVQRPDWIRVQIQFQNLSMTPGTVVLHWDSRTPQELTMNEAQLSFSEEKVGEWINYSIRLSYRGREATIRGRYYPLSATVTDVQVEDPHNVLSALRDTRWSAVLASFPAGEVAQVLQSQVSTQGVAGCALAILGLGLWAFDFWHHCIQDQDLLNCTLAVVGGFSWGVRLMILSACFGVPL
jgi:hypothetical protein